MRKADLPEEEIRDLYSRGYGPTCISRKYGTSSHMIRRILGLTPDKSGVNNDYEWRLKFTKEWKDVTAQILEACK